MKLIEKATITVLFLLAVVGVSFGAGITDKLTINDGDLIVNNTVLVANGTTGYVGINKGTPAYELDVAGTVFADDLGATYDLAVLDDGWFGDQLKVMDNMSVASSFYVTSAGDVGIGTATPLSKLHVAMTTGDQGIFVGEDNANNFMNITYDVVNDRGIIQSYDGATPDELVLNPEGGNVGIRTATPLVPLDVAGAIRSTAASSQISLLESDTSQRWDFLGSSNDLYIKDAVGSGNKVYFRNSTNDDTMVIDTGARRVGIGTSTPDNLLDIDVVGLSNKGIVIQNNSQDVVILGGDTQGDANLYMYDSTGTLRTFLRTDTLDSYFNNPGSYGFGTSTPTDKITVVGAVNASLGFKSGSKAGITDSSSYWLCTAADCSTKCQVEITGGLITGCS